MTNTNIERVKKIKQKIFSEGTSANDLSELIHPEAIIDSPANFSGLCGAEGLCQVIAYWKKAFPNASSEWQNTSCPNHHTVIIHWQASATHSGEDFFSVPAKGLPVSYSGCATYTFNDNGQLIRYQVSVDLDAIKEQIREQ
jgi:predicted ester cyclase